FLRVINGPYASPFFDAESFVYANSGMSNRFDVRAFALRGRAWNGFLPVPIIRRGAVDNWGEGGQMNHVREREIDGNKGNGRRAVHDLVYQEIRQSLMVGTFAPGEKVSLRSLAQQVGTSLTPVREAVNRLIAESAFEVLPNRWVMIPTMTEEKFDEITHWRCQLESDATRRAC